MGSFRDVLADLRAIVGDAPEQSKLRYCESAKVSHRRVFALLTPEIRG